MNSLSTPATSEPGKLDQGPGRKPLPVLIGILVGLSIVCSVVWIRRPVPENYQPPPVAAKTMAEVEQEMTKVQGDERMSASQKARIMSFLNHDMEEAKKTKH